MANVLKAGAPFPNPIAMGGLLDSIVQQSNLQFPLPLLGTNGVAIPRSEIVAMLEAWIAAFTAPKLILYTNNVAWSPNSVYADLTAPAGTWYSVKVVTLGSVHDGNGQTLTISVSSAEWDYSGVSAAEDIVGWALIDVTV